MGLDFSALIRYGGPTPEIMPAVARLERGEKDATFQGVLDTGLAWGFAFAKYARSEAAWRPWSDIERELPRRPDLPALDSMLDLPSYFSLTFGRDAVWVYHTLRWRFFVTEPEWRRVMLAAVRSLCLSLGAEDCIVTHDQNPAVEAFWKDASFQEALQTAEDQGEGAVASVDDLFIDKGYDDDVVYVGPGGKELAVPIWDTHGFWRFDFRKEPQPDPAPDGGGPPDGSDQEDQSPLLVQIRRRSGRGRPPRDDF